MINNSKDNEGVMGDTSQNGFLPLAISVLPFEFNLSIYTLSFRCHYFVC